MLRRPKKAGSSEHERGRELIVPATRPPYRPKGVRDTTGRHGHLGKDMKAVTL
jgi:hypothetical protein